MSSEPLIVQFDDGAIIAPSWSENSKLLYNICTWTATDYIGDCFTIKKIAAFLQVAARTHHEYRQGQTAVILNELSAVIGLP